MNIWKKNNMDRLAWTIRIGGDADWRDWARYMTTADAADDGRWTVWALNVLERFCDAAGCPAHPERLPADAARLRAAMDRILVDKQAQLQRRIIRTVRKLLAADERCEHLLDVLPRHRQREPVNLIQRQRTMVIDDALPKNVSEPWVRDLFREILDHEASAHWRTSKTAFQNFHLIHRFLRSSGLLDGGSLDAFHAQRRTLTADNVYELCRRYTDTFCATAASAKRYVVVFNHLFHRVWNMIPGRVVSRRVASHKPYRRRRQNGLCHWP